MSGIYCGYDEPKKGQRSGTEKECVLKNQLRKYGRLQIAPTDVRKIKKEDEFRKALDKERNRLERIRDKINVEKEELEDLKKIRARTLDKKLKKSFTKDIRLAKRRLENARNNEKESDQVINFYLDELKKF